jgi:hypothetical protein
MNTNSTTHRSLVSILKGISLRRGLAWGVIILCALFAFEIFNFSTTQFALQDVLGNLRFAGISWATILSIAFCGIDFAGIARLFTPQKEQRGPTEIWYLFAAWILAAGMNAILTWWGVSVAIVNHTSQAAGEVVTSGTLIKVVPVFVAIMVWLIRVLIIGTFSASGERLFSQAESPAGHALHPHPALQPAASQTPRPRPTSISTFHPSPKLNRPEPSYHTLPLTAKSSREAEYADGPRAS